VTDDDDPIIRFPFPPRAEPMPEATAPAYSEDAIAQELIGEVSFFIRYVAQWKAWMIWQQGVWQREPTLWVYHRARALCRNQAAFLASAATTEKEVAGPSGWRRRKLSTG